MHAYSNTHAILQPPLLHCFHKHSCIQASCGRVAIPQLYCWEAMQEETRRCQTKSLILHNIHVFCHLYTEILNFAVFCVCPFPRDDQPPLLLSHPTSGLNRELKESSSCWSMVGSTQHSERECRFWWSVGSHCPRVPSWLVHIVHECLLGWFTCLWVSSWLVLVVQECLLGWFTLTASHWESEALHTLSVA